MDKIIQAKSVLKQVWGFDSFRKGQEEIITSVINQENTIAILPTGSGKSIGYQLPVLLLDGLCIVITPLIALMQDQVSKLKKLKISASAIHSGLSSRDIDVILDNCIYGNIKLLYISPERLKTDLFKARAKKMNISFLAIDEAHCISQWGHDFRPSYQDIKSIREIDKDIKMLALTATATSNVVSDIKQLLEVKDAKIIKESFRRTNLSVQLIKTDKKLEKLNSVLTRETGAGIIYVRHRKTAHELHKMLSSNFSCDFYHAGLSHKERSSKQQKWIDGEIQIIIATNAFGMGIDKHDVRYVIHYGLSPSVEEYYQEIGRAGRDQNPANTYLIYNTNDISRLLTSHQKSFPSIENIKKAYVLLCNYFEIPIGSGEFRSFDFEINHFAKYCGSYIAVVYRLLKQLDKFGFISLSSGMKRRESIRLLIDRKLAFELKEDYRKVAVYLLRNIENISHSSTNVNTKKMANELELEHKGLIETLHKMSKSKYIYFQGASEKPFITFLQDRLSKQNLNVNEAEYLERKNRELYRNQSMISFLDSEQCRMSYILKYFEEDNKVNCGHCDYCLKSVFVSTTTQLDLENLVLANLSEITNVVELIDNFEDYKQDTILSTINKMVDANKLRFEKNNIHKN